MPFISKLTAYSKEEIGNSLYLYMRLQTSVNYTSIFFIVASILDSYRVVSNSVGIGVQSTILSLDNTCSRL